MTPQLSSFLLKLICLQLLLHAIAAQHSPQVVGRRPDLLALYPPESSVGMAADWAFCQQKCQEDAICVMFGWSANRRSCFLYPPECSFSGALSFNGTNGNAVTFSTGLHNIVGQIERSNGELVWLSLGRPTMPIIYRSGKVPQSMICRWACNADQGLLPCVGFAWTNPQSQMCELYGGHFDDPTQLSGDEQYEDVRHILEVADPTGNGTLILKENLPPASSDDKDSVATFTLTEVTTIPLGHVDQEGLPNMASMTDGNYSSDTACASECHKQPSCQSFLWDKYTQNCRLFDIALKGTIMLGDSYYGIIDRNAGSEAVKYLIPSYGNLVPVVLASYEPVTVIEECAQKCHDFNQPIYCNSFQLDEETHRCLLYSIELERWTPESISAPFKGDSKFGILEDRKSYNHQKDAGKPINQLIPPKTTPTTETDNPSTTTENHLPTSTPIGSTSKTTEPSLITPTDDILPNTEIPTGVRYSIEDGVCRISARPVDVTTIEQDDPYQLVIDCGRYCFWQYEWCNGFLVDIDTHICELYNAGATDADHVVYGSNCVYGRHGNFIWG